jgi:hypothetical protein
MAKKGLTLIQQGKIAIIEGHTYRRRIGDVVNKLKYQKKIKPKNIIDIKFVKGTSRTDSPKFRAMVILGRSI